MTFKKFMVDGKPFFPIGGQVHNSSAYRVENLEKAFKALKKIHANTIEIPIYWEVIERDEGEYDFSLVEDIIRKCEEENLKIIFLWFGTWKNGSMQYAPIWVKEDRERFKRVKTHDGVELSVLSSHCMETREKDKEAYCRLVEFIKDVDKNKTVIAIQVENEPGIMGGAMRDYSEIGEEKYNCNIPNELIEKMKENPDSYITKKWYKEGSKENCSWREAFGRFAPEMFTAYSICDYINYIAQEGKKIYDIMMYVNVWMTTPGRVASLHYPSGGAVYKVIDLWKWIGDSIDLIAPDNYNQNKDQHIQANEVYTRDDNPLFVPESGANDTNASYVFDSIANKNCIGYFIFAVDSIIDEEGNVKERCKGMVKSFEIIHSLLPLINKYHNTGKIKSVIQYDYTQIQHINLDKYTGYANFVGVGHWSPLSVNVSPLDQNKKGRGLLIEVSSNEFYIAGENFSVMLLDKEMIDDKIPAPLSNEFLLSRYINYASIEEGYLNEKGEFVMEKRRNGDEAGLGLFVREDTKVLRVKMQK